MSRTLDSPTTASQDSVLDSTLLNLLRKLNQFKLPGGEAANLILNTALHISKATAGAILLFDRHTQEITTLVSTEGYTPAGELCGKVRNWLRAASDSENYNSIELLTEAGASHAAALFARDRVQGAVILNREDEFLQGDEDVLEIFAEVTADSLERLNIETEQDMLLEVFEDIGSHLELQEIYKRIERTVRGLFKCDGVSILEKSSEHGESGHVKLRNVYDTNQEYLGLEIPYDEGLAWWAIQNKKPLLYKGEKDDEGNYLIYSTDSIKRPVKPFVRHTHYGCILICPIEYKKEEFGAIHIYNRESTTRFDIKLDPILLSKIGVQTAIAVKNGEKLLRARGADSEPARRITEAVNSTENSTEGIDQIVLTCLKNAVRLVGGDSGFLSMRVPFSNRFLPKYVWKRGPKTIPKFNLDVPEELGIVGRVALQGRYYLTTDSRNDRFIISEIDGSKIAVPLRPPNEEVIGVLSVDSKKRGAFTEQQALILQEKAGDIALYIYKARFLRALTLLARPFLKIEDTESLYKETLNKLTEMLDVRIASILRIEGDNLVAKAASAYFTSPRVIPYNRDLASWEAAEDMRTVVVPDLRKDRSKIHYRKFIDEHRLMSMISVPIVLNEKPLGVINVYTNGPYRYSVLERRLLELLAETLAININNVELIQKEKQQRADLEDTLKELEDALEELEKAYDDLARAKDELQKADEAVANNNRLMSIHEMVTSFAHDARNSLHRMSPSILTLSAITEELVEKKRVSGKTQEELEEIIQNTIVEHTNLSSYFEKLNNYARVLETRKEINSIRQTIDLVLELMAPRIRESKRIKVNKNNLHDFEFVFDRGQIEQVISNLVLNALQAMEKKGTQLYIGTELVNKQIRGVEKECVKIRIADDGAGIQPEHRAKIFDAFFTTKTGTGTGFGLTLCRKIVEENHGGLLDFESEWNKRTVFDVFLPHEAKER